MDSKHLFLTVNGYAFTRHTLRAATVRLAEKVRIHSHKSRHTAAILHLKNRMGLIGLQHLLGHDDIGPTRGYLEALHDEGVEGAARRTSPSDN